MSERKWEMWFQTILKIIIKNLQKFWCQEALKIKENSEIFLLKASHMSVSSE